MLLFFWEGDPLVSSCSKRLLELLPQGKVRRLLQHCTDTRAHKGPGAPGEALRLCSSHTFPGDDATTTQGSGHWPHVAAELLEHSSSKLSCVVRMTHTRIQRLRVHVQSQPRQIVHKILSWNTLHKTRAGGVAQGAGPEFKPQYRKKRLGVQQNCNLSP
jgi:hypothetical protein